MNNYRKKLIVKIILCAVFVSCSAAVFVACHANDPLESPNEATDFKTFTHHAETFKKATAENVRADFESRNFFEYNGVKAEMSLKNGEYFVKFEKNGAVENYQILSVVGDKRVEEYVAEKDGESVRLPVGYDLRKKIWLNLNQVYFDTNGEDFFKHQKNWQTDCASCHLAENNLAEKIPQTSNGALTSLSAHSENKHILSSDASLLACASCHAKGLTDSMPKYDDLVSSENLVRQTISAHQNAAQNFDDNSNRLTAHEYQQILRSVCYVKSKADGSVIGGEKINCTSCHTSNNGNFDVAADAKLHTNQICTSCHTQFENTETITEHTKHPVNSAADSCVACHLPEVVYGNLSFQRTHEISVPNPELTALKQVPNACNQCHADQSVNWAIRQTKSLWTERFRDAKVSTDSQFDEAEGVRGLFAGDAFTRALAANNLAKHSDPNRSKPFLLEALKSEDYPLVRYFLEKSLALPERNLTGDFLFSQSNNLINPQLSDRRKQIEIKKISRRLKRKRPFPDPKIEE